MQRILALIVFVLMVPIHTGSLAWADCGCLSEKFPEKTAFYARLNDSSLRFQLRAGQELPGVAKQHLDPWQKALTKPMTFDFSQINPAKTLILKDSLPVVGVVHEDPFFLRAKTEVEYELPGDKKQFEFTLPARTSVKKVKKDDKEIYVLAEDGDIRILPIENRMIKLTASSLTEVDRIPGEGLGATLSVEPSQAPVGEYITLTMKKNDFQFGDARICVCFRKLVKGEKESASYMESRDVELTNVQTGKAEFKVLIPELGLAGFHIASRVDTVVVARTPDGETAEVLSRQFSVSSRGLAVLCWIIAFVIPWLATGLISGRKDLPLRKRLDPIWYVSGKYGGASLSLAQILLWTMIVFSASFYVLVVSGKLLDLTDEVLILLGIAGGASVIAKITAASKDEKGREIADIRTEARDPKWMDLFQSEGRPDLYRVQLALFTVLAALFVIGKIYADLEFPKLPAGLLTLIGISNGVYLGAKATSRTVFEKLAEKHNELQKAKEELELLTKATASPESMTRLTKTLGITPEEVPPAVKIAQAKVDTLEMEFKSLKEEADKQK